MKVDNNIDLTHLELHNVPLCWLKVPARVHAIGYLRLNHDLDDIKKRFLTLTASFGLNPSDIIFAGATAFARVDKQNLILTLDIQNNHYTFQAWTRPKYHSDFTFGILPDCPKDFHFDTTEKLTELDILLSDHEMSEKVIELLPGIDTMGSHILGNNIKVFTNFQPDNQGRERYLIFPTTGRIKSEQSEIIIDNIIKLENNFHLLSLPQEKYKDAVNRLRKIEDNGTKNLETINNSLPNASTNTLKTWLNQLTADFAELAKLGEESNRQFADASTYKAAIHEVFADFLEEPIENYAPLSTPVLRSTDKISSEHMSLLNRIDRIGKQNTSIISIIRTKIDLLQRDQSFALQCSMNETGKTQMAMQQSIEGLYVFIVAFYLTELAKIIFEALDSRGIIHYSPNILAAYFIPVALLAGLLLSGKIKHWWKRIKYRRPPRAKAEVPNK